MTFRIFAALTIATALCCASPPVQAHEGHHHSAKTKKLKKPKAQKKTGAEFRFTVPARRPDAAPVSLVKNSGMSVPA